MNKKKKILLDILAITLLTVLIISFLWKGASMQGIFFSADEIASDLLHHAYPYKEFFATDYLKKGKFPLWNPYIGSGTPIFGEAQTGVYYPISTLLYLSLPPEIAFNWLIISCFILIGIGIYFYCRQINLSSYASFFASISFCFSGYMVGHLRHVPLLSAVAFLPFCLLAVEKIINKPSKTWTILFALFIFLSFSTGQLTSTYLILFFSTAYFLIRLRFEFKTKPEDPKSPAAFFLAIILGILLSAATLLPALEMLTFANRASLEIQRALDPPFKINYFLMFIFPYLFGDPSKGTWDIHQESYWENIGYVGLFGLGLSIFGLYLLLKKGGNSIFKSVLFVLVLSFLLLLGSYTFLYELLRIWIPAFSYTRIAGRFLLYFDFFLVILSGFGLESLVSRFKLKRSKFILIGVLLFLSIYDLFNFGKDFNNVIPTKYFLQNNTADYLKKDQSEFRIISLDAGEVWNQAWQSSKGWREDLSYYMAQRNLLPSDYNLSFRIASPFFIYGLSNHYGLKRPSELNFSSLNNFVNKDSSSSASLLGMENVKYIITAEPKDKNPNLEFKIKIATERPEVDTFIYQNLKYLPRAYLVFSYSSFNNTDKLLSRMFSNDFDPSKEVLLEEDLPTTSASLSTGSLRTSPQELVTQGKDEVTINSYQDTKVEITAKVDSNDGGFLVLSDTYYPGWKAYIDGKETKIYQANYAYRAIYLDKGKHKIVFNYDPLSVKIGQGISIISLLAVVLFLLVNNSKKLLGKI